MGYVSITVGGSFVRHLGVQEMTETFSAMKHGHADAVARAIEHLAGTVLPRATAQDHDLHATGAKPRDGFAPHRIVTSTPGAPDQSSAP